MDQNRRDEILDAAYGRQRADGLDPKSVAAERRLNSLLNQIPELEASPDALPNFLRALEVGEDSVVDFAPVAGRQKFRLRIVEAGLVAAAALVIGLVLFGLPDTTPDETDGAPIAQGWTYRLPQRDLTRTADEAELSGLPFDDESFRELIAMHDRMGALSPSGEELPIHGLDFEDWEELVRKLEY
jgi:hypothetical protein